MASGTTLRMWRRTLILLVLLIGVGFGLILFNLIRLQLVEGEELKSQSLDQSLRTTSLSAQRGSIYDCNGNVLAESASVWTVALEPAYIEDEETCRLLAEGLSEILDMEEEDVYALTQKNTYFTYVKRKVETSVRDEINAFLQENNIKRGVQLIEDYKRYYPYGDFLSQVLGFTGVDSQGLSGLEIQYDEELSGTSGRLVTAKNAAGTDMPFEYEQKIEAQDGSNLYLTIDSNVQSILEEALKQGIVDNVVQEGAVAICMNVKTGAILGMAVEGSYDPNDPFTLADEALQQEIDALPEKEQDEAYNNALQKQWRNKAVSDTYYPGSVFKMCTGSMALEEGIVTEETTFTCTGATVVAGETLHCWTSRHGTENFVQGLCNSCNPYFMWLGEQLGAFTFFKYFNAFGFTEKTGIDLPGEGATLYHGADMGPVELATESFGQNFSITPVHMITACAAVANGGYLVQPHLVERIEDSNGNILSTADTTYRRQVISEDTSSRMVSILHTNATSGTAKNGYVAGYRICGKTGTSQKILEDNIDKTKKHYIASYCGFAPADDPEIALLIFFDEPEGESYYGSAVAGPVFASCMSQILPYLGVEPIYTEEELDRLDTTVESVTGEGADTAKTKLEQQGFTVIVKGDGDTVLAQNPAGGEKIPKQGTVVLYTTEDAQQETVTVPKLTGLSLSEVNQTAVNAGVQIRITGAALSSGVCVSQSQSIAEGEKVKQGTVITVNFIESDTVM